jgi:hypothetical protein
MNYRVFFILPFAFVLTQCSTKKNDVNFEIISVNFRENILLSELIETNYEYLPLQSANVPLIGAVNKLIVTEEEYFILDSKFSKQLLRFNHAGQFLNSYGSIGEGYGQYMSASEVILNNDEVELVDYSNSSILKFKKNGEFIDEYKVPYWIDEAFQFDDTKKIFYSPYDLSQEGGINNGIISIASNDLNKIYKSYLPYQEVLDDSPFPGFLTRHDSKFTFAHTVTGELYYIDEQMNFLPRFKVDFNPHHWPLSKDEIIKDQDRAEVLFNQGGVMSVIHRLCETDDFLTFHTLMVNRDNINHSAKPSPDTWFCIYDKAKRELYAFKEVINDIDGGPFPLPLAVEKNNFLGVISSEHLLNTSNKNTLNESFPEHYNTLKALKDSLNISSNPILMRYQLKSNLIIK